MKIIGLNGSPRKDGNSAKLLAEALRGAEEAGAETESIYLYDKNYKGCRSCFACKRKSPAYGKGCMMKDDLSPILEQMLLADAWVFATPIYLGHMSSSLSALLERLEFSHHNYDAHEKMLPKEYPSLLLYSMNGNTAFMDKMGIESCCKYDAFLMESFFGHSSYLMANSTLQFDDYSKYHTAGVPVEKKTAYSNEHFPLDLKNAYQRGRKLAQSILSTNI